MTAKLAWDITKGTFNDFLEDKAMRLAAALAYYSIFSLGPLLLLMVGLAGLVFGQESVRQEVDRQLQSMMGQQATGVVESMMSAQQKGGSLVATIIGVIGLLIGASGVFGQLQDALNTVWEVQPKPGRGVWGFIRDRFLSFSMVLGTGFLLLISMVLTTMLSALGGYLGQLLTVSEGVMHVVNGVVAFGVITVLFAFIFKVLPDVKVPWKIVWIGAVGTALLFTLGKYLLGLYLGMASTASAYGAAGSVVVLLLWVYYAALILFLGAEFTQVYATKTGERIVPAENAEPLTPEARAQQGTPGRKAAGHRVAVAAPAPAYAGGAGPGMVVQSGGASSPGAVLREHRWQFIGAAVVMAVAARYLKRTKAYRGYQYLGKARNLAQSAQSARARRAQSANDQ